MPYIVGEYIVVSGKWNVNMPYIDPMWNEFMFLECGLVGLPDFARHVSSWAKDDDSFQCVGNMRQCNLRSVRTSECQCQLGLHMDLLCAPISAWTSKQFLNRIHNRQIAGYFRMFPENEGNIVFFWAGQSQKFSLTLSCWWELMIWTFLYVTEIRDSTVLDQKDWGCRRSPNIKRGEWYTGGGWFCQASLDVCAGELLGWNEVGISGKILLIRGRCWTWPFSLSILWYLCYQFIIFSLGGPSGV